MWDREEIEQHRRQAWAEGRVERLASAVEERRLRRGLWLADLGRDLRHSLRLWRRNVGFTLIAVLILALGIGANTAIFTLIDALLLRPLPVPHPEQLVALTNPGFIGAWDGTETGVRDALAYSEYLRLRDGNRVFSGLLAAQASAHLIRVGWGGDTGGLPETLRAKLVSGNYFSVLGVDAARGRLLRAADDGAPGAHPVAVMSYGYWQRRFGGDSGVLGRTVRLQGGIFTIVGITSRGFGGENIGDNPELYFPLSMQMQVFPGTDWLRDPPGAERWMWLQAIGRLKPGATLAQAAAACNVIFARSVAERAAAAANKQKLLDQQLQLHWAGRGTTGLRATYATALLALWTLVGLVLLMAVVNLASMLLARATTREKEISMRLALGAGQGRLVRQLLTESLLLACAGGALGLLLAQWGDRLLERWVSTSDASSALNLHPDLRVLGVTAGLSVLAGLLFGLVPALRLARQPLSPSLPSRSLGGGKATTVLAVVQVAVSVLLLTGAGIFARSLQRLRQVPLGFQPRNLSLYYVDASGAGYHGARALAFYQLVRDRIAQVPGVASVAISENGVFEGGDSGSHATFEGNPAPPTEIAWDRVEPGYLATLGVPVLRGRGLLPQDATGAKPAVINQTAVQQFFARANPLGKHITLLYPNGSDAFVVVGVVADFKFASVREKPAPRAFLDISNGYPLSSLTSVYFEVRTRGSDAGVSAAIRQAVHQLDPSVPPPEADAAEQLVGATLGSDSLLARLSGFFGGLALLLAAVGLYGVMSYAVARRTAEIGVRMALGATPRRVMRRVLREVLGIVAMGLAIGVPASFAAAHGLASLAFGLSGGITAPLLAAAGLLFAVALAAGYFPARRASRVDPLIALRTE